MKVSLHNHVYRNCLGKKQIKISVLPKVYYGYYDYDDDHGTANLCLLSLMMSNGHKSIVRQPSKLRFH